MKSLPILICLNHLLHTLYGKTLLLLYFFQLDIMCLVCSFPSSLNIAGTHVFTISAIFRYIFYVYIFIRYIHVYIYVLLQRPTFPPWPRSGINIRSYFPVFIGQTDTRNPIVGEGIKSLSFYTIFLYKLFLTPADSSLTTLIELRFVFTKRHSVGYVRRMFFQPIFKPKMSSVVNIRRCHTLHATVNSGALPACTFTGEPHWLPLKSYHHPPLWWSYTSPSHMTMKTIYNLSFLVLFLTLSIWLTRTKKPKIYKTKITNQYYVLK